MNFDFEIKLTTQLIGKLTTEGILPNGSFQNNSEVSYSGDPAKKNEFVNHIVLGEGYTRKAEGQQWDGETSWQEKEECQVQLLLVPCLASEQGECWIMKKEKNEKKSGLTNLVQ